MPALLGGFPNPLTTIALHDKGGAEWSVYSFGARGVSAAVDTAAYNAAAASAVLAGGGSIIFPPLPGNAPYRFNDELIAYDNVVWEGVGWNSAAVLWWPTDLGAGKRGVKPQTSPAGQFHAPHFKNLNLHGPGGAVTVGQRTVQMDGLELGSWANITDCYFTGWNHAILTRADHNWLTRVEASANWSAFWLADSHISVGAHNFIECAFVGNAWASIEIAGDNIWASGLAYGCHFGYGPYGIYKGDTVVQTITDAVMTAASATLQSNSGAFTSGITGKVFNVAGAGVGGDQLIATATYVDASHVTLGTSATGSVSGAMALISIASNSGAMQDIDIRNTGFELCGNAAILDESTGSGNSNNSLTYATIHQTGFSWAVSPYKIPGRSQNWAVNVQLTSNARIYMGGAPFTAGAVGAIRATDASGLDIDGDVTANMFGSGSTWSSAGATVHKGTTWNGRALLTSADVTLKQGLEWFGGQHVVPSGQNGGGGNQWAGVAMNTVANGGVCVVATRGSVKVAADSTASAGVPLKVSAANLGRLTPVGGWQFSPAGVVPDLYPVVAVSENAGGSGAGADLIVTLQGPAPQRDAVWPAAVTALPTASSALRGQYLRVNGGTGVADHTYICRKNAADAYEWAQLDN